MKKIYCKNCGLRLDGYILFFHYIKDFAFEFKDGWYCQKCSYKLKKRKWYSF